MKKRITALLDRELERLDTASQQGNFDLDSFRQLDLLIRSLRTLAESLPDAPEQTNTPPTTDTDALLAQLTHDDET